MVARVDNGARKGNGETCTVHDPNWYSCPATHGPDGCSNRQNHHQLGGLGPFIPTEGEGCCVGDGNSRQWFWHPGDIRALPMPRRARNLLAVGFFGASLIHRSWRRPRRARGYQDGRHVRRRIPQQRGAGLQHVGGHDGRPPRAGAQQRRRQSGARRPVYHLRDASMASGILN